MKNQRKGVGKMKNFLKRAKKFLDLILFRSKEREIERTLIKRRNRLFMYDGKYGRYSEDGKENDLLAGANLEMQGENTIEMLLYLGRQLKGINEILDNFNPNVDFNGFSFYSDVEIRRDLEDIRRAIVDI